jgi:hypothetical protein
MYRFILCVDSITYNIHHLIDVPMFVIELKLILNVNSH